MIKNFDLKLFFVISIELQPRLRKKSYMKSVTLNKKKWETHGAPKSKMAENPLGR